MFISQFYRSGLRVAALYLVLSLSAGIETSSVLPAWSVDTMANHPSHGSMESRLNEVEMSLFRLTHEKDTPETRIKRMETLMYGSSKEGDLLERLKGIEKDLFNPYTSSALPLGRKKYEPLDKADASAADTAPGATSNQTPAANGKGQASAFPPNGSETGTLSQIGGSSNSAGQTEGAGAPIIGTTGSANLPILPSTDGLHGPDTATVGGASPSPDSLPNVASTNMGTAGQPTPANDLPDTIPVQPVLTPPSPTAATQAASPSAPNQTAVTLPGTNIPVGDGKPYVMSLRKEMFVDAGDDHKAKIAQVTRVLRQDPLDALIPDLYFERAKAEIALDQYNKAKADLDEAIRNSPMRANLYLARAFCHNVLKEEYLAREDIARARFTDPRLPKSIYFDTGAQVAGGGN